MCRLGRAVFKDNEMAKKLIKKGFIIVNTFEEGKGKIIIIAVKNFLNEFKLLCK